MKIIDYKILQAGNRKEDLEQQVLQALAAGWQLQGGVSFGGGPLMQAVVRVAQEPKGQSGSI
jgi:hypothetical protein